MADSEVVSALNVLKRYSQIDSILFYTWKDGDAIYLPAFQSAYKQSFTVRFWRNGKDYMDVTAKPGNEQDSLIKQWKLAKLAIAFL